LERNLTAAQVAISQTGKDGVGGSALQDQKKSAQNPKELAGGARRTPEGPWEGEKKGQEKGTPGARKCS